MPDRTFSAAYGYDKAHPTFQFVKDGASWRPLQASDFGVSTSGDINISGVYFNTDNLETLGTGQLLALQQMSGDIAVIKASIQQTQIYPFLRRSSNEDYTITQQVNSVTFANVGSGIAYLYFGSNQKALNPTDTASYDAGNNYMYAPRFISSGTILVVNGISKDSSVVNL